MLSFIERIWSNMWTKKESTINLPKLNHGSWYIDNWYWHYRETERKCLKSDAKFRAPERLITARRADGYFFEATQSRSQPLELNVFSKKGDIIASKKLPVALTNTELIAIAHYIIEDAVSK